MGCSELLGGVIVDLRVMSESSLIDDLTQPNSSGMRGGGP
jgi:hypothetical protein